MRAAVVRVPEGEVVGVAVRVAVFFGGLGCVGVLGVWMLGNWPEFVWGMWRDVLEEAPLLHNEPPRVDVGLALVDAHGAGAADLLIIMWVDGSG